MSWWTDVRDTLETVGGLVANYFYPGTIMLGQYVNSKGSQEQLFGNPIGQLAGLATGIAGGYANAAGAAGSTAGGAESLGGSLSSAGAIGEVGGQKTFEELYMSGLSQGLSEGEAANYANAMSQSSAFGGTGASGPFNAVGEIGNAGQMGQGVGYNLGTGGAAGAGVYSPNNSAAVKGIQAGQATGAAPWGSPSNITTMLGGVYGIAQSQRMQELARQAQRDADPFAQYRSGYAKQLSDLMANPESVSSLPGYGAGIQAVNRGLAAQGYLGSGNAKTALLKYGGDFYQQALQNLSYLSGAGANPATAANLGLQGNAMGISLAGSALNNLAYGFKQTGNKWPWQGE